MVHPLDPMPGTWKRDDYKPQLTNFSHDFTVLLILNKSCEGQEEASHDVLLSPVTTRGE